MNPAQVQQQHPIAIYLWIWGLLFVLSVCSYLVDYVGFEGFWRWFLITVLMLLKAGLIVAVFMHMLWERLAMRVVLLPTGALLVLMTLMALEANYTLLTRLRFFFN